MITVTKKPPVISLCDNVMLFEFTTDLEAGTDGVFLLIQPWYYDPHGPIGEEILYPAVPGAADTDLSEYLRRDMFAIKQFAWPEQGNIPWNAHSGLIKKYKIQVQECWFDESGDPVILTTIPIANHFVVRGKIPKWKWAAFYAQYNSFYHWITTASPFLTLAPKTQRVKVDQVQKLYLPIVWDPSSGDTLKIKVDIIFTDGTDDTFTTTQQTGDLDLLRNAIIEFGVSYSLLNLSSWANTNHPGKTIYSYAVTAMSGSTVRSETRTYIVDRDQRIGQRQFLFSNSVGGYDSLMATGRNELTSNYSYDTVRQQSPGIQALAEKKQLNVDELNIHTCRTGYFNAEMAEYMAEFFLSEERYEISGSTLIPIILENSKVLRKRDSENEFYAEFDYQYALNQKVEVG